MNPGGIFGRKPAPISASATVDEDRHIKRAKELVLHHYNHRLPQPVPPITIDQLYIVMFSYVLGNWKALVSTNIAGDGIYYEVTHNASKGETYVDCYNKVDNKVYRDNTN